MLWTTNPSLGCGGPGLAASCANLEPLSNVRRFARQQPHCNVVAQAVSLYPRVIDEGCLVKTPLRMHAIHVSSLCEHVIGTKVWEDSEALVANCR
jgi:hypothetical protein